MSLKENLSANISDLGLNQQSEKISLSRKLALEALKTVEFPTVKDEEWKYTNIRPILNGNYSFKKPDATFKDQSIIKSLLIPELDSNVLVFVNGRFEESLSSIQEQDRSIFIGSLANIPENFTSLVDNHFGKLCTKEGAFTALNTAGFSDGLFLHVPKNVTLNWPIHLLNVNTCESIEPINQYRNLLILEKSSSAVLIESYHVIGLGSGFENIVTEVFVDENANLEHYKLQTACESSSQICLTEVSQKQNSTYTNHTISWCGKIIRNNLNTIHEGQNCLTNYFGLYIADTDQIIDNHTFINHAIPHCNSNESYRGIVAGSGKAVFNGKVLVQQDAQKTLAYQSVKNLLLSENATIYAKPELEIFADDVKCSHGATIGSLDKNELFYLEARCISKEKAKAMLTFAFANEIIEEIKIEALKLYLTERLEIKLNNVSY